MLVFILIFSQVALTQSSPDSETAVAQVLNDNSLTWQTPAEYGGASLVITGVDGYHKHFEFSADEQPIFTLLGNNGDSLPDGQYTYELRFKPLKAGANPQTDPLATGRDTPAGEQTSAETTASSPVTLSGTFTIQDGLPLSQTETNIDTARVPNTITHLDDVTIVGSLCTGFDCSSVESFNLDTLRIKESNLRIHFDDTSASASFPDNDWRIIINDATNGGANYFAVENSTSTRVPFTISDSAVANSLYVSADTQFNRPRIGMGTNTPDTALEVVYSDTPVIRIHQDSSENWPTHKWDLGGNEANFFIRNATTGGNPFRIEPGAAHSSIIIRNNSRVGIAPGSQSQGFTSLDATLHVKAADATFRVQDTISGTVTLDLDSGGNLTLNGLLTEASDRALKENVEPINHQTVLDALAGVPINTWNYISDKDDVRHMGPMAQDFYAAFGLGVDNRHIAPLDANGVALAGVQELYGRLQTQESQITALEKENEDLEQRLAELEAAVAALLAQQEK